MWRDEETRIEVNRKRKDRGKKERRGEEKLGVETRTERGKERKWE